MSGPGRLDSYTNLPVEASVPGIAPVERWLSFNEHSTAGHQCLCPACSMSVSSELQLPDHSESLTPFYVVLILE